MHNVRGKRVLSIYKNVVIYNIACYKNIYIYKKKERKTKGTKYKFIELIFQPHSAKQG